MLITTTTLKLKKKSSDQFILPCYTENILPELIVFKLLERFLPNVAKNYSNKTRFHVKKKLRNRSIHSETDTQLNLYIFLFLIEYGLIDLG